MGKFSSSSSSSSPAVSSSSSTTPVKKSVFSKSDCNSSVKKTGKLHQLKIFRLKDGDNTVGIAILNAFVVKQELVETQKTDQTIGGIDVTALNRLIYFLGHVGNNSPINKCWFLTESVAVLENCSEEGRQGLWDHVAELYKVLFEEGAGGVLFTANRFEVSIVDHDLTEEEGTNMLKKARETTAYVIPGSSSSSSSARRVLSLP
jgi:hypothetical protein